MVAAFTVDTKLFQELGELLVAKESTALVELIKNAYDADATVVTIRGTHLADANAGSIDVIDDGSGMSRPEFEAGFLRIAGRSKVLGDRRSTVFGRRFTGEKGVGRLAAHKLARAVIVHSAKAGNAPRGASSLPMAISIVRASIDWDAIEKLETLEEVAASKAIELDDRPVTADENVLSGTVLRLAPIRRQWTRRMIDGFLREALTLTPPPVLWERLPEGTTREPLLFEAVPVRDQSATDPGFRIDFAGDLSVADAISPDVAEGANWIAEIDFERTSGLLRVAIEPTEATLRQYANSEGFRFEKQLEKNKMPSFRGRILQRSNSTWDVAVQGIRVFMEGFRVPPYGDATDDWLGVDRAYRSRGHRQLTTLASLDVAGLPEAAQNEYLSLQGSNAYMGAIYLHRSSSPELEMLVNREGFLPGNGLDFLAEWVRITTDLIVRVGYASRKEVKEVKKVERIIQQGIAVRADVREIPSALRVRESALAVTKNLDAVKVAIAKGDFKAASAAASAAQPELDGITALSEQFSGEALMWRVLASLGTELAAFVHEVNALALEVSSIVGLMDDAIPQISSTQAKSKIRAAKRIALTLADRIRRNATYLVDATSFEGRRRRSRLPLKERFQAVTPFFDSRLSRKSITLLDQIPSGLQTPPMFPAEVAGIFANLMSNAVKFTDIGGKIRVGARIADGMMNVTMENSGTRVDLAKSDRLFDAFVSTTERPDAVLGQGMGMGLTITRCWCLRQCEPPNSRKFDPGVSAGVFRADCG